MLQEQRENEALKPVNDTQRNTLSTAGKFLSAQELINWKGEPLLFLDQFMKGEKWKSLDADQKKGLVGASFDWTFRDVPFSSLDSHIKECATQFSGFDPGEIQNKIKGCELSRVEQFSTSIARPIGLFWKSHQTDPDADLVRSVIVARYPVIASMLILEEESFTRAPQVNSAAEAPVKSIFL